MKKVLKIFGISFASIILIAFIFYHFFPGLLIKIRFSLLRSKAGMSAKEIQVKNHKWTYLENNIKDQDTIVFIHGFGGSKDFWINMLPRFSRSYRVIVPDLPGFGEHEIVKNETYDIKTYVKLLDSFLEKKGITRFHLIGISLGGYISGYYASLFPDKLKSLALLDAAGIKSRKQSYFWNLYLKTGENLFMYDTVEKYDKMIKIIFHKPPSFIKYFKSYIVKKKIEQLPVHKKIFNDLIKDGDNALGERLHLIKTRTLVIWGEKDQVFDVSSIETIKEKLKGALIVLFKDVGHVPVYENLEKTVEVYRKFLLDL